MRLSFNHGEEKIEFEVIYRKRKTLSIKIEAPGIITVIAPEKTKSDVILNIVKNKESWIIKKLSEMKEKEDLKTEHAYINGEDFLYLGLNYALQITINESVKKPFIKLDEDLLYMTINENNSDKIRELLEEWYRWMAYEKIMERIEYYQIYFNVKPNNIKIKKQEKRWGSCSSKKDLFFNWKIIMAPLKVLDYIVVHEMSHMAYMNHSRDFWDLVERIMPDYRLRKEWLKKNGVTLNL